MLTYSELYEHNKNLCDAPSHLRDIKCSKHKTHLHKCVWLHKQCTFTTFSPSTHFWYTYDTRFSVLMVPSPVPIVYYPHALPASITLILSVFKWDTHITQTTVTVYTHTLISSYVDVLGYPTVHWQNVCILYCKTSNVLNPRDLTYVLMYVPFTFNLIFVVPSIMLYSSEISPTRCNNCVFILRNGFTLHVSDDNLNHHQEYICCIWPQVSRLT